MLALLALQACPMAKRLATINSRHLYASTFRDEFCDQSTMHAQLQEADEHIVLLKNNVTELKSEVDLLYKQNDKLKDQINDNLNEGISMENSLNEENARLVALVYELKTINKNLTKELDELKYKLCNKGINMTTVCTKYTSTDIILKNASVQPNP